MLVLITTRNKPFGLKHEWKKRKKRKIPEGREDKTIKKYFEKDEGAKASCHTLLLDRKQKKKQKAGCSPKNIQHRTSNQYLSGRRSDILFPGDRGAAPTLSLWLPPPFSSRNRCPGRLLARHPVSDRWRRGVISMGVVGTLRVCWPSFGFVCRLVVLPLLDIGASNPLDVAGKVRSCEPVVGRRTLVGGVSKTLLDMGSSVSPAFDKEPPCLFRKLIASQLGVRL